MKQAVAVLGVSALLACACSGTSPQGPNPTPNPTPAPTSGGGQAPPPPQAPSAAPPSGRLQARACSEEAALRSAEGTTLTSIEFQNVSGVERRVHWLNYQGGRQLYNTIPTASAYNQPTYLTHPWVVTDASGACVGIFVPIAQPTSAVLEPTTAAPPLPSATTRSCSEASQLRSTAGNVATAIQFQNQTAGSVKVIWIDYQGQRIPYNALDRGASYTQPTFVGHPWIVTDAADQCLTVVIPSATPTRAVIQ